MNLNINLSFLKKIKTPELSTSMLMGLLSSYKAPQKQIHTLVKKNLLKPIKQGVYVVHEDLGLRAYSKEILANMIYGPSYISLETALSNYGFIPERVTTTSSVCFGNSRSFDTPIGSFEYCHVKENIYPFGITIREIFDQVFCQYATPEKALIDFIYLREKAKGFHSPREYFDYLVDSYRLEVATIQEKISLHKLQQLSLNYSYPRVDWFVGELIRRLAK